MRLRALAVGIIGSFFDIKLTFMSYAFKMCYRRVTSAAIGPLRLPFIAVIKMKARFLLSLMPFRCKNGIIGMGLVDYTGSWGHFWFMLHSICCIMVQVTFCVCAWLTVFSVAFYPSFWETMLAKKNPVRGSRQLNLEPQVWASELLCTLTFQWTDLGLEVVNRPFLREYFGWKDNSSTRGGLVCVPKGTQLNKSAKPSGTAM